jgi:hypothetical protein
MEEISRARATMTFFCVLGLAMSSLCVVIPEGKATKIAFNSLPHHNFENVASSLQVVGTVTLYEESDLGGHSIPFDANVPRLGDYGWWSFDPWPIWHTWNDITSSLEIEGTVTLFDGADYAGNRITFTSSSIPYSNIGVEWNANSLLNKDYDKWDCVHKLWDTGHSEIAPMTSENYMNWTANGLVKARADDDLDSYWDCVEFNQGTERSSAPPTFQPILVTVGDKISITLEGIVDDWATVQTYAPSWTGGKFDIFAVENQQDGRKLMLEMYFMRDGLNLFWGGPYNKELFRDPSTDTWNYLIALDAFPEYVTRVVHPGDAARWTVNVKAFIERACQHWSVLNMNNLYLAKLGYTLEAAYQGLPCIIWSNLNRLRLAYVGQLGGGCPTLFTWNGHNYVDYGVINIHNPTGEDVVREVSVETRDLDTVDRHASIRLREGWPELTFSESFVDQVKLYAVSSDGTQRLCPLTYAWHSRLGNVRPQLLLSDDRKAESFLLETIDLTFSVPYRKIRSFLFVIEGCNPYKM